MYIYIYVYICVCVYIYIYIAETIVLTIRCSVCCACSTNNCFDFRLLHLVDCIILHTPLQPSQRLNRGFNALSLFNALRRGLIEAESLHRAFIRGLIEP